MASEFAPDVQFEIGHVLLIDIVGYSKLLINEQRERVQELNELVRNTAQLQEADGRGNLLRIPTGDGDGVNISRQSGDARAMRARD
jgi:hypothetical protein